MKGRIRFELSDSKSWKIQKEKDINLFIIDCLRRPDSLLAYKDEKKNEFLTNKRKFCEPEKARKRNQSDILCIFSWHFHLLSKRK
jgi:hypothetical protein